MVRPIVAVCLGVSRNRRRRHGEAQAEVQDTIDQSDFAELAESVRNSVGDAGPAARDGVVNFIGASIPFLGAVIGGAFAVLMAISEGGVGLAVGALAVVLFTNAVLENLLEARFLGSSLKLHPIVVLLSTVVGGVVAGMAG